MVTSRAAVLMVYPDPPLVTGSLNFGIFLCPHACVAWWALRDYFFFVRRLSVRHTFSSDFFRHTFSSTLTRCRQVTHVLRGALHSSNENSSLIAVNKIKNSIMWCEIFSQWWIGVHHQYALLGKNDRIELFINMVVFSSSEL